MNMKFDKYENRRKVGQMIARLREDKGMTQQELADAAKINRVNLSKIENGRYNVSIDILGNILSALSAEIDIKQTI